ncbi:MAG TPA: SprB repeat-containing protein [Bacteroidia bacterium]|nr:SprB repeat-containing protein [Bacteroidia bacterium]
MCATVHAQNLELQLSPSVYNGGYHISCYDGNDGSIDLTVLNGTAPYTFIWSNEATTEDISGLSEGYYSVEVRDANDWVGTKAINIIQPREISLEIIPVYYPNGYHISCYGCFNGQASVLVDGGVPPYQYMWSSGHSSA